MRLLILAAVLLASANCDPAPLMSQRIIKGTDQFEFVYRVKLPEIKGECPRLDTAGEDRCLSDRHRPRRSEHPDEMGKVQDRDYGNDICVLYPLPADSGKTIELRYRVVRKEKAAYPASVLQMPRVTCVLRSSFR